VQARLIFAGIQISHGFTAVATIVA